MVRGADRGSVLWMILREVLMLIGWGVALALWMAFVLSKLAKTQLYGMSSLIQPRMLRAATALAFVALCADLIPARRASSTGPTEALRQE